MYECVAELECIGTHAADDVPYGQHSCSAAVCAAAAVEIQNSQTGPAWALVFGAGHLSCADFCICFIACCHAAESGAGSL